MAKIRKGDTVKVIAGKDKGVTGTVLSVLKAASGHGGDRLLVEGVNRVVKHTKIGQNARGAKTGGLVHQEAPIHISNVMLVDEETRKPTRVGFRKEQAVKTRPDGTTYTVERNVRVSRRSGKDI
ncbi:MAG: 50S ribosomal protein L24 [Candidatus Nanopelagicales bacterium]